MRSTLIVSYVVPLLLYNAHRVIADELLRLEPVDVTVLEEAPKFSLEYVEPPSKEGPIIQLDHDGISTIEIRQRVVPVVETWSEDMEQRYPAPLVGPLAAGGRYRQSEICKRLLALSQNRLLERLVAEVCAAPEYPAPQVAHEIVLTAADPGRNRLRPAPLKPSLIYETISESPDEKEQQPLITELLEAVEAIPVELYQVLD